MEVEGSAASQLVIGKGNNPSKNQEIRLEPCSEAEVDRRMESERHDQNGEIGVDA